MRAKRNAIPSRPKLIAASVAACFALPPIVVLANPTGPSVVAGQASFASSGNQLTVTNTANAIIQWRGFSIGVNEITRFLQSSSASAVLNRVVGAGGAIPQSVINGLLTSNGRVFLINPAGVVVGPAGRIDVAGFYASSLALSNEDFVHGKMRFTAVPGAGDVINGGVIQTQQAGRVYLVAPNVENSGVIHAPDGQIMLAAGKSVELASADSPGMTVQVTADSGHALNLGSLIADSGRIGMFGALVRNSGVAEANAAVAGPGGQIRFVASQDVTLDPGSRTTANGTSGGVVTLQAQNGTSLVGGTVEATGSTGQGGSVQALGVRVGVVGKGVIDASGATGGGTVLVGGGEHGVNPAVQNAQDTYIGKDGVIRADAGASGDGGRVIVWSNGDTGFYGSISARGGAQSGNGGFVETSGKNLQAFGSVDAGAPHGAAGAWLLDPDDADIVAGSSGSGSQDETLLGSGSFDTSSNAGSTSQISAGAIESAMSVSGGSTGVTIHATQDVNVDASVDTSTSSGSLTLQADRNVNLNSNTISTRGDLTIEAAGGGPGSITSTMPSNLTQLSTNGGGLYLDGDSVKVGGIVTAGGAVRAEAYNGSLSVGAVDTGASSASSGGSVNFTASSGAVTAGDISTGGGNVDVMAGGNVTLGNVNTGYDYFGGYVSATTTGGSIVTGTINTAPRNPGMYAWAGYVNLSAGGAIATGSVDTSGGAGSVYMQAGTGDVTTGAITTRSYNAYYGGGNVYLGTGSGRIVVNGNIDTRGADGPYDSCGDGCLYYDGSWGGSVGLYRADMSTDPASGTAVQVNGSILTSGGDGAQAPGASSYGEASSGSGGWGGDVRIGDGSGGALRGAVSVTGTIDTHGGDGAAGPDYSSGNAGSAGYGGSVLIDATGAVQLAAINTYGGRGGIGALNSMYPAGADGGEGGNLNVSGSSIAAGTIDAHGGDGGAGGSYNGGSTPDGGYGGNGASGTMGATGVLLSATGAVSTGSINTAGGAGGAGADAASPAGNGGNGGLGGPVSVTGGSVTINGIVSTTGGPGGAGGAGNGTNAGGTGGTGGTGGDIVLDARPGTGIVTFVNGGYDATGGAGAAGGADGGLGAGVAGSFGDPGTVNIFYEFAFVFTPPPPSGGGAPPDLGPVTQAIGSIIAGTERSTDLSGWFGGGYQNDEDHNRKKGVGICKP
jgi:filamentous hemagglutinin family protein